MSKPSLATSFLAGSVSGTCSTLLFQPLDLVKTRLQIASRTAACPTSLGMVGTASDVVRHENVSGLWRGLAPSLSRTIPGVGLYFTSLTTIQHAVLRDRPPGALEAGLLGAGARAVTSCVLLPFTVVKTRYESGHYQYRSVRQALYSVGHAEGLRGLYSGLLPTMARDAPFSGFYYMFYSQLKDAMRQSKIIQQWPEFTGIATFCCGLLSGVLACALTHPADVVKTRLQVMPNAGSTLSAIRYIFKNKGVSGFFTGMAPRVVRRSLMASMAWTVYERLIHNLTS